MKRNPDSKVPVAIMGPTWVLSSPGGPHVGPMNLAIWEIIRDITTAMKLITHWPLRDVAMILKVSFRNALYRIIA